MNRIAHLDYLRGLAALSVMLFHFEKWGTGIWTPQTFLGKSGVYAVSVFFVLSGLTLTLVYPKTAMADPANWTRFWIKRLFRILPLLWLATAATIFLDEPPYPIPRIALNFSGLFGFFDPAADIALGAWSIGDELVYYAAFPLLLALGQRFRAGFLLVLAVSLVLGGCYAFRWTHADRSITEQWPIYVQPLNHAFFFIAGIGIARWYRPTRLLSPLASKLCAAVCLLLYLAWRPGDDPIGLVTGTNRVVLSALVIGFATCWYAAGIRLLAPGDRVFRWLGEVSYSIYLLHPLVYRSLKALDARYLEGNTMGLLPLAVLVTLVVSHFSYKGLEKPFQQLGQRFARRIGAA